MAVSSRVLILTPGTPVRVDELCPHCFLPALLDFPLLHITAAGVSELARPRVCTDCRRRIDRH